MKLQLFSRNMRFLFGVGLLVFSALACTITLPDLPGMSSEPDETELARHVDATLTAIVRTEQENETGVATSKPAELNTPVPTATTPPTETPIPSETPVPSKTPLPTASEPTIGSITFARGISKDGDPVDPAGRFKKGITEIYLFFDYAGMKDGMNYTLYWEVNGKEWLTTGRTWKFGESGVYYTNFYYTQSGHGLPAGNWIVRVYVESKQLNYGSFTIY